jgi:hypothetical protein
VEQIKQTTDPIVKQFIEGRPTLDAVPATV